MIEKEKKGLRPMRTCSLICRFGVGSRGRRDMMKRGAVAEMLSLFVKAAPWHPQLAVVAAGRWQVWTKVAAVVAGTAV
jgi:hypothetical protein